MGGPWILVISFIRVFRLGDCFKEYIFSRIFKQITVVLVTLAGGNFFGLQGRASDTGEYSRGMIRGVDVKGRGDEGRL